MTLGALWSEPAAGVPPAAGTGVGWSAVEIRSDQPPVMVPLSNTSLSTTKSCQVPLGSVPSKTDRADPTPVVLGAGAGNVSPAPT